MPRKSSEPIAAGGLDNPSVQFRQFAAECLELAQTTVSLEKRKVYLEMARIWHQMALRWEKKVAEGIGQAGDKLLTKDETSPS
jgi:hypothetical protein